VINVETDYNAHSAIVTFDDAKTDVEELEKALEKGNYPVTGKPRFLK